MTVANANDPAGFSRYGSNLVCLACGAIVPVNSAAAPIDAPKVHTDWHATIDPR